MGYNIYDPLSDWNKRTNDLRKSVEESTKNIQNNLYQNDDAPMDYIRKIDKNLNDTIPSLEKMVDILKAQSESALSQSESAKTLAEKAISNSGSADKKSMFSIAISLLSLAVTLLANADSIYINVIKILSHLGVLK